MATDFVYATLFHACENFSFHSCPDYFTGIYKQVDKQRFNVQAITPATPQKQKGKENLG